MIRDKARIPTNMVVREKENIAENLQIPSELFEYYYEYIYQTINSLEDCKKVPLFQATFYNEVRLKYCKITVFYNNFVDSGSRIFPALE